MFPSFFDYFLQHGKGLFSISVSSFALLLITEQTARRLVCDYHTLFAYLLSHKIFLKMYVVLMTEKIHNNLITSYLSRWKLNYIYILFNLTIMRQIIFTDFSGKKGVLRISSLVNKVVSWGPSQLQVTKLELYYQFPVPGI